MSPSPSPKASRRQLPAKRTPERDVAPMNATAAKLLVAAGDLMIERNSTDISLSDIAEKSGVNSALVKYHFGNKDGLLLRCWPAMRARKWPTLPSCSTSQFRQLKN